MSYHRDRRTRRKIQVPKNQAPIRTLYIGDPYNQRNLITVYKLYNAKLFKAREKIGIYNII